MIRWSSRIWRTLLSALCLYAIPNGACHAFADSQQGRPAQVPQAHFNRAVRLPVIDSNDVRFARLSTSSGLSQTRVAYIVQDGTGFIWFGTQYGLNRYDGYNFKVFTHVEKRPNSLSGVYIHSLFKDRSGMLWIGCDQYLDRLDPRTERFTHYRLGSQDPNAVPEPVVHIRQDRAGFLWLSTGKGLYRLDPATGEISHYEHDANDSQSLSSDDIKAAGEDREGNLWVASGSTLDRLDRDTAKVTFRIPLPEHPGNVFSFFEDHLGELWLIHKSARGGGLELFDRRTNTLTPYLLFRPGPRATTFLGVNSMMEDRRGNLWLATAGMGLLKFDRQHQSFLRYQYSASDPESLSENNLTTVFEDNRGNIWAGFDAQPPAIFSLRQPLFFQLWPSRVEPASKAESLVSTLFEDREGRDWIGWFGGLTRVDRRTGESRFYSTSGSGIGATAIAIIQEPSGSFWIGTHGQGLKHFDPRHETFKTYRHDPTDPRSLSNDNVARLLIDHTGTLWAATWDGLNRFNTASGTFDVFRPGPKGIIQQFGWIVEDPCGMIWLGGNSGLTRFDPATGRFQVYKHDPDNPHSISSNRVIYVYFARSGAMWIGTQNGLGRRDPATGTFSTYTDQNGLAGNVVACVQEDDSGALWMSTNRGISRFDPQRATFRNYSAADGLPGDDLTGWSACYKNTAGEIFFGGFSGAVVFNPKRFAEDDELPKVVLTDLKISGKSVNVGEDSFLKQPLPYVQSLTLSHVQRNFSLEFAALTFLSLATNRYRYKLDGFDREWNEVGNDQRVVNYTALPSGSYTFHVQVAGLRGQWGMPGAELRIEILPAWWATWWFRLISAALILVVIWLLYKLRVRHVEERERQFRKLAENAPDIVMRFDPGMRYSYVNPIVEEYTGLAPRALLGRTNREVSMSPKNAQSWEGALREVFSTGRATMREFTFDTPKGERYFESRLVPEVGAVGSTKSVLAITRDITDRKRAAEALRRSEAYLGEAQKLSHTGSFGWDVSSGEIYWSAETFRIFEFETSAKVTIDLIVQRTHPDDRSAVHQLIERVSREKCEFDLEHRLLMPDGSVKYLRVVGRPSTDERGRFEFVGAVTDVTARKQAEEERERLRQTQADLARVTRVTTMGELTASLAHEVNQPIAAAITNSSTCLRWLARDPPDVEEAREAVSRIVKDATRAADIIKRIRLLFKKGIPQRGLVDVNEVIRDVIVLLRNEAYRHSVAIRTDLAAALSQVMADGVQLQQVLTNLMLNGIEAMKEANGARELTIKSEQGDNGHLLISVSDTGVGLTPQQADQIFKAFFTTKAEGTGMGLPISRSIIESHGGRLWAAANSGRGATFHFTLPSKVEGRE
jgi:PAS domain S-box-containing protein